MIIGNFSDWTEAFPTKCETSQTVTKKLLKEILRKYGFSGKYGQTIDLDFCTR